MEGDELVTRKLLFALFVFILLAGGIALAQTPNITAQPIPGMGAAGAAMIPVSTDMCKSLPTAQRAACEAEIQRSGGRMTPEAIQAIKDRSGAGAKGGGPTPDDAAKSKTPTEQKERPKTTVEEYKERSEEHTSELQSR